MKLGRVQDYTKRIATHFVTHYVGITLLVMAPLLGRGYILTLDMVFAPTMPWPEEVSHNYLFALLLHWLTLIVPGDLVQKGLLLATFVLAGVGMHRLARWAKVGKSAWPAYAAGIFFMVNPFVYSRFMAGQYLVLLGYALLPFFVQAVGELWHAPDRRRMLRVVAIAVISSIVSIHSIGFLLLLAIAGSLAWGWHTPPAHYKKALTYMGAAALLMVLLCSYWLVPLVLGHGPTANHLQYFGPADYAAFATQGQGAIEKIGNVLQLQGFWVEGRDLFILPQEQFSGWNWLLLMVWATIAWGILHLWRQQMYRPLLWGIGVGLLAVILALGVGQQWLLQHIPFFKGYREPHKFTALVALSYAWFFAWGVAGLRNNTAKWPTLRAIMTTVLLALPLLLTSSLLWGASGQLRLRQYPEGWEQARRLLRADNTDYKVLFLPWHQYMYFSFAGRLIANPAPAFFGNAVVVSNDPEIGQLHAPANTPTTTVGHLATHPPPDAAARLAAYGIKYIIVAKELDYKKYQPLVTGSQFTLIDNEKSIQIYQNKAY